MMSCCPRVRSALETSFTWTVATFTRPSVPAPIVENVLVAPGNPRKRPSILSRILLVRPIEEPSGVSTCTLNCASSWAVVNSLPIKGVIIRLATKTPTAARIVSARCLRARARSGLYTDSIATKAFSNRLNSHPCRSGSFSTREQSIGERVRAMKVEMTTAHATVRPNS